MSTWWSWKRRETLCNLVLISAHVPSVTICRGDRETRATESSTGCMWGLRTLRCSTYLCFGFIFNGLGYFGSCMGGFVGGTICTVPTAHLLSVNRKNFFLKIGWIAWLIGLFCGSVHLFIYFSQIPGIPLESFNYSLALFANIQMPVGFVDKLRDLFDLKCRVFVWACCDPNWKCSGCWSSRSTNRHNFKTFFRAKSPCVRYVSRLD